MELTDIHHLHGSPNVRRVLSAALTKLLACKWASTEDHEFVDSHFPGGTVLVFRKRNFSVVDEPVALLTIVFSRNGPPENSEAITRIAARNALTNSGRVDWVSFVGEFTDIVLWRFWKELVELTLGTPKNPDFSTSVFDFNLTYAEVDGTKTWVSANYSTYHKPAAAQDPQPGNSLRLAWAAASLQEREDFLNALGSMVANCDLPAPKPT
jgi:hypothetical protein